MMMNFSKRSKEEGISLRTLHIALIVFALAVSCYLIYSTSRLSVTYQELSAATDRSLAVHKAGTELMDAADYLTEMAQRYALDGNSIYLHSYFEEELETRRREAAIEQISAIAQEPEAIRKLLAAMEHSAALAERDYYAMKLVTVAVGLSPIPEPLQDVALLPQHAALPAYEKKEAAQHMVSDEEYYRQKDLVRNEMRESLAALEEHTRSVQATSEVEVKSDLRWVRIVAIVQAVAIMLVTWLLSELGITPIMKAVDMLREDSPIPVIGANEFRYLAKTYNKMFEVYKSSVASLNFKANHDELTKVYNRAGYDLLMSSLDLSDACLLLIDVDLFKTVNDTYGHETGDRVLQKVAAAVSKYFRTGDYVCRIGGDEFVAIMLKVNRSHRELIASKIEKINGDLADGSDGLPPISVSVGAAFGNESESPAQLYEHADAALYETKRKGRKGISFYEEDD